MKNGYLWLIIAVSTMFSAPLYADQDIEKILKSIVKIRSIIPSDARTARFLGTKREGNGVVIDSAGHIITIGYLVLEAEVIEIEAVDGTTVKASLVGYDHNTGFGLIRADMPLNVSFMKMGRSSEVQVEDPVLVASYGGLKSTQAARVVSLREFAGSWEYLLEKAIFTAPPYSDYGGAALIARNGRLIGIGSLYTQVFVPELGLIPGNMFVPIDQLKPILSDLISKGHSLVPLRPWLGLNAEEVRGYVMVSRITRGGPAEQAGIQPGNIILSVENKGISSLADFYRKVWALGPAGVAVPLSVLQRNRVREIIVHSSSRNQFLQRRPAKLANVK